MKKKMPSEGLRLGRDSGSIICDTLKKWRFRTGWGGTLNMPIVFGVSPKISSMTSHQLVKLVETMIA